MHLRYVYLAFGLLTTGPALATTEEFIATCLAHAADLSSLPAVLEARGLEEIDPAIGPQFLALPESATRRLWQRPVPAGQKSPLYVGVIAIPGQTPLQLCVTTGFPGDDARTALEKLQRLYPPHPGSIHRGTEFFYGGEEGWTVTLDGRDYAVSVSWPIRNAPETGASQQLLLLP